MPEPDKQNGAENIFWELKDLYHEIDSDDLTGDKVRVRQLAESFSKKYRGRIATLDAETLRKALEELETIQDILGRMNSFAYLTWSTDTENSAYGKLVSEMTEYSSTISQELVFFEVEWLAMTDDVANRLLNDSALDKFHHYLEASRRFKPHILSEKEEKIMTAKSVTAREAWVRFFDETLGSARYELDGKKMTEQEILSKLHSPDRDLRGRAAEVLSDTFRSMMRPLTYIFNTILVDKQTNDAIRGYNSWVSSRNLSNEIDDETVKILVDSVMNRYDLVNRFYKLKRRLLGYEVLYDYDRYAPIVKTQTTVTWDEACRIVTDSYQTFHPRMGEIVTEFFEKKWIDAAIRPGKRSGAYSASTVPSVHPYVFLNYDGQVRDVQTLAHELGHGIHQYLSRRQGVFQADTPLTTAETASVFGEMLTFQRLYRKMEDPREKLSMLISKIDDTIATVFRQVSMNRFEDAMHNARRREGELTSERFSELWYGTQTGMYGDSVSLTDNYKIWWCYIPHFLHTPGYVYAYAFGELLVLALYEQYQRQGEGFADRYLDLLSAGGSDWPEKLIGKMGLDIKSPVFWHRGLDAIERMINEAEQLSHEVEVVS